MLLIEVALPMIEYYFIEGKKKSGDSVSFNRVLLLVVRLFWSKLLFERKD